jgi:serine protease Do
MSRVARYAALAVVLGMPGAMAGQAPTPATAQQRTAITPPAPPGARPAPASFAALTEQLSRSVVNISTTQVLRRNNNRPQQPAPQLPEGSPFQDFFNDFLGDGPRTPRRVTSLGSGFIIDPSGLVVTNYHVIEDADEISVVLNDNITTMSATLVGRDPKTDLALLKVTPKAPLPSARWGDSDRAARVGDWVIAIGNPFGMSNTVTAGIISARNRGINAGDYDDFIQTDASINRGNSGGPLFNMNGEVIGVNSAIFSPTGGSVGIGFAIPSNDARGIIAQLQRTGRVTRGMIGINIQQLEPDIAASMNLEGVRGALVSRVTPNGPAAKAGLQNGDVITTFDGRPVDDRSLPRLVANTAVGKSSTVEFIRRGQKRTANVVVARLAEDDDREPVNRPAVAARPNQTSRLGVSLQAISPEARNRYRIENNVNGVVVTAVDPTGPAGDKVRAGDVIVEVAQQRVTTPAEVDAKVDAETKAGRTAILLLVNRGGQQSFIGVRVPAAARR